jgi:hypothetical protein
MVWDRTRAVGTPVSNSVLFTLYNHRRPKNVTG